MRVSHKGYQPINSWHNVWAVEKADRTEPGFFTGHFLTREDFGAVTVISEPFFLVMLNTELLFGGRSCIGWQNVSWSKCCLQSGGHDLGSASGNGVMGKAENCWNVVKAK